ncbi:MAG: vitamin K epoxide reductase family protein [Chloroflexaceae bacterium]|nr:vitamin K epoxide reductase family protein [Chloroflexaceae bacterium]
MRRRRSVPWIHRWSRPLIGAIAIIGALLTAYLTVAKLTGGEAACLAEATGSSGGCSNVLNSEYATIFGLPLSLFGFLAYSSMAAFALGPLAVNRDKNRPLRTQLENWTWLLLLAGATAMAVFSGYLMYVLATDLKTLCPYCIGSATFALALLVLTIIGREWEDMGQIAFTGVIVAVITLVGTLGIYASQDFAVAESGDRVEIPEPTTDPQAPDGWEITTTSGAAEIALAQHLRAIGAKEYGAFWCPHCFEQKQLFGKEAFEIINYVECDPRGKNPQVEACRAANIRGFPTWEIKGQTYSGTQSLERLAQLSDYQGPANFKYFKKGLN